MAQIIHINPLNPEMQKIQYAADCLASGGVVIFPTETVYGIGALASNDIAVRRVFEIKSRPADKPLLLHLVRGQEERVAVITDEARQLIDAFTPGPLSVILNKKPCVSDIVTSGGSTVGLRFPSNRAFISLCEACQSPLAATSANISGAGSVSILSRVEKELLERADLIIDSGENALGVESTIVDLSIKAKLIRQGAVSIAQIRKYINI